MSEAQAFHPANKNRLGEWAVTRLLLQPAFRRAFGAVYAYASPEVLKLRHTSAVPVIYCATHVSWWDGYMAGLLNRTVLRQDSYLMMEEANLVRYWFFTWIGVFGVNRDDPRKALASVGYTAQLLTEKPGRAVWIFPQGTITHPDTRPLRLFGGIAHIVKKAGKCAIVPVAFRYEFLMEQAPDAFAHIGTPFVIDSTERMSSREITARIEAAIIGADNALHADMMGGHTGHYRRILLGKASANKTWDGLLKLLGKLKPVRD